MHSSYRTLRPSGGRVFLAVATLLAGGWATFLTASGNAADQNSAGTGVRQNTGTALPPGPAKSGATFNDMVNQELGLASSQIVQLGLDPVPGQQLSIGVPLDGQVVTLNLTPHSVRSNFYQVIAQTEDGSYVPMAPGPVRTMRGTVLELPASHAFGSVEANGLHASIVLPDGNQYWIEPIFGRVPGAQENQYVIYHDSDTLGGGGECGLNDANMHDESGELLGLDEAEADGGLAGGTVYCVELACDADFEYYVDHGSSVANVEAAINSIMNSCNIQYEDEVDIRFEITAIIVRTAEPDPYTSSDAGVLLTQFRTHWINNQQAIPRDLAQLFTGKELDGSIIGLAWGIGEVCTSGAYCLVQSDFSGNFSCKTDLSSHECGHLWGATHCSCPSFTMNPTLTCANNHAAESITEILNYRNAITCDTPCEDGTTTLPFSDNFPSTTIDGSLWTGIEGATSNTTGTNEPSAPNSLNLDGNAAGGDEIRTALIDTSDLVSLTVEFFYERRGGGDSPETNDDLVVEYINASNQWIEVDRQLGSGVDQTNYVFVSIPMPAGAFHQNFRLRFRAISTQVGLDDWFVDNVGIVGFGPPANDTCATSTLISLGATPFTTMGANSGMPLEPNNCNFGGDPDINSDVWFRYNSQCNQLLTVSVCNANFDTKMAVYTGGCTTNPDTSLACNDDSCGTGSSITIPVQSFTTYRIRIGSASGAQGTGTLNLSCDPLPPETGPCCLPNGTCQGNVTQSDCETTLGGTYLGDGLNCGDVVCSQPTGACCLPGGRCQEGTTQTQCEVNLGGTYQGNNVTCGVSNCVTPTGACCLPNGTCTDAQTNGGCSAAGGVYQGDDTTCAGVSCPSSCPEDIAPPGGNGVVDIDDLFTIIAEWGNTGGPADIAPPGGNGIVDIDDLFAVIGVWGPCQ